MVLHHSISVLSSIMCASAPAKNANKTETTLRDVVVVVVDVLCERMYAMSLHVTYVYVFYQCFETYPMEKSGHATA